jgi:hypothetical protein
MALTFPLLRSLLQHDFTIPMANLTNHGQILRDHAKVERGKNVCPLFATMDQYLYRYKKEWLLYDATIYAGRTGSNPPERLARWSRDGLVLWYCRHRPQILENGAFEQAVTPASHRRLTKNAPPESEGVQEDFEELWDFSYA